MRSSHFGPIVRLVPQALAALILSACGSGTGTGNASDPSATADAATSETAAQLRQRHRGEAAPAISGSPAASVVVGQAYAFHPTTTDPGGARLAFSIVNQPAWATFSTSTGALTGTPASANVGAYADIVIRVSDAYGSSSLAAFSISVDPPPVTTGSATLSWTAPTQNTDGTGLTDLTSFTIFYGTSSSALTQTINVPGGTSTSYVISNLSAGTYYFAVAANASDGTQSARSAIGSKTIT